MKWNIKHTLQATEKTERIDEIIKAVFINRELATPQAQEKFLNPDSPYQITPASVGIDPIHLATAISIIQQFIKTKSPILIYGDYDADGITATAIMWETLHAMGANVHPFIPSRELHGYGLSQKGLADAIQTLKTNCPTAQLSNCLIITVDNGIVAHEPICQLKEQGATVIITDHHQLGSTPPPADAVVHSTLVCGAGVAWLVSKQLLPEYAKSVLDLACIGTIADMMPLIEYNRSIVKFGLEALRTTKRPGLKSLYQDSKIDLATPINTYHVNYIIAPRLNATGRLEHAFDSLRLLCTKNDERAKLLAGSISDTNRTRQDLTLDLLHHAKEVVGESALEKIIIIDHDEYHEGVIGLIAGKLVETYSRPAIVISRKDGISKASARSIKGINITEFIRSQSHLLVGVGGHPMAAGFSIQTEQIETFKQELLKYSATFITEEMLVQSIDVDCEIEVTDISNDLYQRIQQLQPFGIGNLQPLFALNNVTCLAAQQMGSMSQHLKLLLESPIHGTLSALWFGHGDYFNQIKPNQPINLLATIDQNSWRGKTSLQLMIKNIS